jgi:multicomponent Na+:H+ antiporter subunit C
MAAAAALLFGIGTYLVLQHTLSRILIGIALITHGANILLMGAGRRGSPPIIGTGDPEGFSDPLPQALALTAIVISFGVSALLLALAYRSWLLTHDDEVEDDVADRAIAVRRGPSVDDKELADERARDAGDLGR